MATAGGGKRQTSAAHGRGDDQLGGREKPVFFTAPSLLLDSWDGGDVASSSKLPGINEGSPLAAAQGGDWHQFTKGLRSAPAGTGRTEECQDCPRYAKKLLCMSPVKTLGTNSQSSFCLGSAQRQTELLPLKDAASLEPVCTWRGWCYRCDHKELSRPTRRERYRHMSTAPRFLFIQQTYPYVSPSVACQGQGFFGEAGPETANGILSSVGLMGGSAMLRPPCTTLGPRDFMKTQAEAVFSSSLPSRRVELFSSHVDVRGCFALLDLDTRQPMRLECQCGSSHTVRTPGVARCPERQTCAWSTPCALSDLSRGGLHACLYSAAPPLLSAHLSRLSYRPGNSGTCEFSGRPPQLSWRTGKVSCTCDHMCLLTPLHTP